MGVLLVLLASPSPGPGSLCVGQLVHRLHGWGVRGGGQGCPQPGSGVESTALWKAAIHGLGHSDARLSVCQKEAARAADGTQHGKTERSLDLRVTAHLCPPHRLRDLMQVCA